MGEPLLDVCDLSAPPLRDINLTVHKGEVVAVFGLLGAGVHTLGKVLFGEFKHTGTVTLAGKAIRPGSPSDSIRAGLGLLTENRKEDGLVLPLAVKTNMTLAALGRFTHLGWIDGRSENRAAAEYVNRLAVKTPSLSQQIRYLSGGNQQKVLIGRWMLRNLRVVILSEPTRGIDVGAKAEIYRIIDQMAHQGMGILVLSTELPEVLGVADRILVLREGRISGEFTRGEADQEKLMQAAAVSSDADAASLALMTPIEEKVGQAWQQ
jgi:ABC-type sugar transport system ATPase subunit